MQQETLPTGDHIGSFHEEADVEMDAEGWSDLQNGVTTMDNQMDQVEGYASDAAGSIYVDVEDQAQSGNVARDEAGEWIQADANNSNSMPSDVIFNDNALAMDVSCLLDACLILMFIYFIPVTSSFTKKECMDNLC